MHQDHHSFTHQLDLQDSPLYVCYIKPQLRSSVFTHITYFLFNKKFRFVYYDNFYIGNEKITIRVFKNVNYNCPIRINNLVICPLGGQGCAYQNHKSVKFSS